MGRHPEGNRCEAGPCSLTNGRARRERDHEGERPRPKPLCEFERAFRKDALLERSIEACDVRDQRVVCRPRLGCENPLNRGLRRRISAEAINRLCRKGRKTAAAKHLGRCSDAFGIGRGDLCPPLMLPGRKAFAHNPPFLSQEISRGRRSSCAHGDASGLYSVDRPRAAHGDISFAKCRRTEEPIMTYRAPIADILFSMAHESGADLDNNEGPFADLSDGFVTATLAEAGKFAENVFAPLNRIGDREPPTLERDKVFMPPGFAEAYRQWRAAGWNAITGPADYGGMGLPALLNTGCLGLWSGANMAFSLCPLLTLGAIEAMQSHASEALKAVYLSKLVSGEWPASMTMTEPQAGSDLGALKMRAERQNDGTYKLFGSKIFITFGEHDMAENIVHFVLARVAGAPEGTRGISLFLVPKFLVNPDGSLGARNDVRAHSIEHKLGIHGAPTCTMVYGDHGGATGFLVGEEHRGMACMFTMMNSARLAVGLQGVAIAERATQQALAYARERRQGRTAATAATESTQIIAHPDVRRMLITMRALTQAARTICYATAMAIDRAERSPDKAARQTAHARASLLTPLAKAYSTDIGVEVASLNVQVHGGMGYIEETGAAQLFRDARITTIYEGTNGIQAIDLVTRKLPLEGGAAVESLLGELCAIVEAVNATNDPALGLSGARLQEALESLARATRWMLDRRGGNAEHALAGATPYLRLFGIAAGGCLLAQQALAALRLGVADSASRIALARFFAENLAVQAGALERTVIEGAAGVIDADAVLAQQA